MLISTKIIEKEDEIIIERKIENLTITKLKTQAKNKEIIEKLKKEIEKETPTEKKIINLLANLQTIITIQEHELGFTGKLTTDKNTIIVRTKNMETTIKLATRKFNYRNSFSLIKEYTTLRGTAEVNFKTKYFNIKKFVRPHDIEKIGLEVKEMEEKMEQLKKKIEKILSVTDEIIEKTEEITENYVTGKDRGIPSS
jgi:TolA-binding protein